MLLALLGLITIISVPTLSAQQVEVTPPTNAQTTNTQLLLQQGIELYESQNFSQAVAVWQRAATAFAQEGDNLRRALVLSNLASAYQELGQWSEAQAASVK